MSQLFRSEEMKYYSLAMPRENAWDILNELGEISCLQFIDQQPGVAIYTRPFANFIHRCEDVRLKLAYIEEQMGLFNQPIRKCDDYKTFLRNMRNFLSSRGKAENTYFEELEAEISEKHDFLVNQISNFDSYTQKKNNLLEFRSVLIQAAPSLRKTNMNVPIESSFGLKLNYLCGLISKEDEIRFKRMVFRVSKGNVYSKINDREPQRNDEEEIIDPKNLKAVKKQVFTLLFTGGNFETLKKKLTRVCESFGATIFDIPENKETVDRSLQNTEIQINELNNIVKMTKAGILNKLDEFSAKRSQYESNCSLIEEMKLFFIKEKCLYHTQNMMTLENNIFFGYCWCPTTKEKSVNHILNSISSSKGFQSSHFQEIECDKSLTPPTSFSLNDFTGPFQDIVNTYGIPRYREINPGLFTIVTFPFLFAIMFGDMGHGTMLFLFSLYVILNASKLSKGNSFLKDVIPIRYLLLLMGFFAAYCGLLYNDFMSLPLNLFGSCYNINGKEVSRQPDCVYSVGVDPAWIVASNELSIMNSLKMKLAVIFGVVQMTVGVILKGVNNIYFGQTIDFFHEFLPQLIFMVCTFGWMDTMIFIKWLTVWEQGYEAPSIINLFMNMVLGLGSTKGTPLWSNIEEQEKLQLFLLVISAICIPWMFFMKPILLKQKMTNERITIKQKPKSSDLKKPFLTSEIEMAFDDVQLKHQPHASVSHDEENSELVVHQLIETIEFVLGSISNTASYLRLWALSLAHSQLSKVFFEKGVKVGLEPGNFLILIIGVFIFLNITFAVLMCMDLMECFLHALRLHWVEFQNKFYKADGYKFEPFCFEKALKE